MLSSSLRLKKSKDFEAVWKNGRITAGNILVAKHLASSTPETRLGISIGTKFSPLAHERNRMKRQIRAAFNALVHDCHKRYDVVIMVKKGKKPPFLGRLIKSDLEQILKKANIINS